MFKFKFFLQIQALFGKALFGRTLLGMALLGPVAGIAATPNNSPVVAELFTSQGCSSCPPAEAFFNELAKNDQLVVLQWHVDYWDTLRHGAAGRWKDPYSSPDFTQRQVDYNLAIHRSGRIFTPQAVINGKQDATGSNRNQVNRLIRANKHTNASAISSARANNVITFTLLADMPEAKLTAVKFLKSTETDVRGGENKGRYLTASNIVTGVKRLDAQNGVVNIQAPQDGYGCALIVHDATSKNIISAQYCPE